MASQTSVDAVPIVERLQAEVERSIQRSLKGFELLGAPPPSVGAAAKTMIHRRGGHLSLYHYHPMADEVFRVPVLLVMATTNKAFVFDMAPGQSLIEYLLKRGHDVYVIDWNPPSMAERDVNLETYVLDFLPDCIHRVQVDSGIEDVSIIGYCAGGLLSVLYAALNPDGPLKNLVTFTTPIDFSRMELFRRMADPAHMRLDQVTDADGLVPASRVVQMFNMLRPASELTGQIRLWDNIWNDAYVKQYRLMERWGAETLPLPGGYARQMTQEMLQKNALFEGTLKLGGRQVDLSEIKVPLLSFAARYDHIVPPECARPLIERVGSVDKEEVVLPGGHVSLVAGPNAVKRMWPKLNDWLEKRST